jgi:hypothetical protein
VDTGPPVLLGFAKGRRWHERALVEMDDDAMLVDIDTPEALEIDVCEDAE